MGKGRRRSEERNRLLRKWGVDRRTMSKDLTRQTLEIIEKATHIDDFQGELCGFGLESTLRALSRLDKSEVTNNQLGFALGVARVIREVARCDNLNARRMSPDTVARFVKQGATLMDPFSLQLIKHGNFLQSGLTRTMADQMPLQRDLFRDIPRSVSILYDSDSETILGSESWVNTLGISLPSFLLAITCLESLLRFGPINIERHLQ